MAYLTKYGSLWGAIPNTAGDVYWVAPADSYTVNGRSYSASDENDGLSPERAFRRVGRAVDLAVNAGDVVVLLPGAHSVATSIAMDSANVTLMGLPSGKGNYLFPKATLAMSAVDQTLNVTAAGVEIAHIAFLSTTSQASALIDFSAAASRLYIHDCAFDLFTATAATTILGIDALGAASYVLIEHNHFNCDGAFGASVDMTATLDSVVSDNVFVQSAGTLASSITTGAATDRCLITRNQWVITNAAAVTACIDGTGATIASGVLISYNAFGDRNTVPVDNYDAAEAELAENYEAGLGATDGGVLITVIT